MAKRTTQPANYPNPGSTNNDPAATPGSTVYEMIVERGTKDYKLHREMDIGPFPVEELRRLAKRRLERFHLPSTPGSAAIYLNAYIDAMYRRNR